MKQYIDLIQEVLHNGVPRVNRTTQNDIFIPSGYMKFDLRKGFPAVTTKQLFYKQSIGEILGFIRGYNNAADFRALGCKIWDSDANENKAWLASPYRKGEDDLGKIYGSTWRNRTVYKTIRNYNQEEYLLDNDYNFVSEDTAKKDIDQLEDCIDKILHKPNDRRIIMHAWFPELFDEMALPPCHCLYRFVPDEKNKILHMQMYQRSCDLFLGVPFNIFGSALLLSLIAKCTGYEAGEFSHFLSDVHLYDNAIEQAKIQRRREPKMLPVLDIQKDAPTNQSTKGCLKWLENIEPHEIQLFGYNHHEKLERVEMAQEL